MLVVGFTGHSGSGKTTLIETVLEALIAFVKPGLRK